MLEEKDSFILRDEETEKSYIVYTDNSLDEKGNVQVFASTFIPNSNDTRLMPVETEKEWKIIEIILEEIQAEVSKE